MTQEFHSLRGKKVFVTGHTGFTGSWVSIWLHRLGCDVFGYSLEPETKPNLFTEAKVAALVNGKIADIRDFQMLRAELERFQPDLILHLAAQPLVRRSYRIPRETFEINSQGTANLLDAARGLTSLKGILCVTTDKVYKNLETDRPYIESDELGGRDPYSASKAAAEITVASFRSMRGDLVPGEPVISVARGGNIIGGGDWSEDRLIPDFIRAFESKQELVLRFPDATRPWQHVVSLVHGYLLILEGMLGPDPGSFDQEFNLGPSTLEAFTVRSMLDSLSAQIPGVAVVEVESPLHESQKLILDSSKATKTFGWDSRLTTPEAVERTASWFKNFLSKRKSAHELCCEDIDYMQSSPVVRNH